MEQSSKIRSRLFFSSGELLKFKNGTLLEVVFADEEKAVCLKIKWCNRIGWTHTGKYIVVSNKACDYMNFAEAERLPSEAVTGRYHWEPLAADSIFIMN